MKVWVSLCMVGLALGEMMDLSSLSSLKWVPVTDRQSLMSGLSCTECILDIKVNNGTEYLHLGGRIDVFLPIVARESQVAASSDLSLESALTVFRDGRQRESRTGLHISFLSPSILPASLQILSFTFPDSNLSFPLLVSADVLDSSGGRSPQSLVDGKNFLISLKEQVPGSIPVLGWTTYHGLDPVWDRLRGEGILKDFQTVRLEGLVDELYRNPAGLATQEVRFAELLSQKLGRNQAASFTSLTVTQLVAAIETNGHHKLEAKPWAPRLPYRPPRKDPVRELLPEYYLNTSHYTETDISSMAHLSSSVSSPLGFSVRAGLLSGGACTPLTQLLDGRPGSFLTVSTQPSDREDRDSVAACVDILGRDRLLFLMEEQKENEEEEEILSRIPEPRLGVDGGVGRPSVCILLLILLISLV